MRILLDTNAYSDFMRGDSCRVQLFRTAQTLYIPIIVLGELRAGFAAGKFESTNAANLHRFLNSPRVEVLQIDQQTTYHYAQLYLFLRKKSVAVPTNDLWIAALGVQHNLILCTSDVHFKHFPQLPIC